MSITAYKRTITDTESPRQIERRVFSSVTAEIEDRYEAYDRSVDKHEKQSIMAAGLRDSLWRNQKLWMTLRGDLTEPGNALPSELKAGLISLALWVDNHTKDVFGGRKDIKPLLEVNRSIIRGLEGNPMRVME